MEIKNNIIQHSLIICTFFIIIFSFGSARAATHYVSPSGSDTWGNSTNKGTPCSLATANANAADDDVVVLLTGSYTTQMIAPVNSGSSGHPITFQKNTGATCTFMRTGGPSVTLSGDSYIVIDGLTFASGGQRRHIWLKSSSHYNEIKNCTFYSGQVTFCYPDIAIDGSDYNYLHNNTHHPGGAATDESGETDIVRITNSDYNRVIDNDFFEGHGHFFIMISQGSDHNVVRGNTGYVSKHWTDVYAGLDFFIGGEKTSNYNLIENNVWTVDLSEGEIAAKSSAWEWDSCSYNIIRRNVSNQPRGHNAFFIQSNRTKDNKYNVVYNNTYYNVNRWSHSTDGVFALDSNESNYTRYNQFVNNLIHTSENYGTRLVNKKAYITDNKFRNNIYFNAKAAAIRRYTESISVAQAQTRYPSEFSGNLTTEPTFEDATNGEFTAKNESSNQVDAGAWLTTITSTTGSGTTFTVDNPHFFYDGWSILGEKGDNIRTQSKKFARIISINYSTGHITVDKSISWTKGEGIALDYQGTRPDIGAKEYLSDNESLPPPNSLHIIANN